MTYDNQDRERVADPGRSKVGLAGVLAVMLVLVAGAAFFYMRQGSQATSASLNEAGQTQPAASEPQAEAHAPEIQSGESDEAAAHIVAELKRVQLATEKDLTYAQYDEMISKLNADVNNALIVFSGQSAGDETFRQEAAAAVREYAAARNWWQTTNEHSNVFNDADRNERLQLNWGLAKTHIENAEKALSH